ncbi:TPM domain-containing protein [Microbacterium marinilacus]|uniref:TPM domain-containing protein n=1 Tax=Microbacterium marinilacus TaxID=415209 RepID=A0ABP7B6J3_9MICO|nr:TPM domain-containing protein [Microbacterium marinilacus]
MLRAIAVLGVVGATAFAALPAAAEEPVELGSGYVYDGSDVLSDAEEAAAQQRLEQLSAESGLDLWVVYVDDFEDPSDAREWADDTAIANGLGIDQYLLAASTSGRTFYLSGDSDGPVSDDRLGQIENEIQPFLSAEDWSGAIDAAADGLTGGSGSAVPWVIGGVVGVAAVGGTVWFVSRRRKGAGGTGQDGAEPQVPTEELQRRAATALVATDDAVRASEQELGFAVAQFGSDATGEFEQALKDAKAALAQAFELKQKLDDGEKDTEQEVRDWNAEIVRLCETASAALSDKQSAFAELRRIEQDAPAALAEAQRRRTQAQGTAERVEAAVAQLGGRYAPDAVAIVSDNPVQVGARLAFADEQLAEAQRLIDAGDGGEAAVAIRGAEQALAQAAQLEQAVADLDGTLTAAEQQAVALVAELEQDLARARTLGSTSEVAAAIAAAEQAVATARQNLEGTSRSPQALLQALQNANTQIDGVVAGAQRAQQLLGQTLLQARSQVTGAEEFIAARRGSVGADARTRLAEAGAELTRAEALQVGDPAQALQRAQRALQLAAEASRLAQSDAQSADWGGGLGGGVVGGGGMVDGIVGGLIGGLISGSVGGSRSRGPSGWGGGMGGMLGGGSYGGRGGSSRHSGSFGGRSSGRSGGRSSGGGRGGRRGGGRF